MTGGSAKMILKKLFSRPRKKSMERLGRIVCVVFEHQGDWVDFSASVTFNREGEGRKITSFHGVSFSSARRLTDLIRALLLRREGMIFPSPVSWTYVR